MAKIKMSREFKIGFFGVLMVACLYGGINFVKGMDLFSSSKKYYGVYDRVNGVQKSASVMVRGYKIGTVTDMILDPGRSDKVVLEFSIKSRYKIPANSEAVIFTDGLMGGKAIEIVLGSSPDRLSPGDTLRSSAHADLFEIMGPEFASITSKLNTTLDGLNKILDDNSQNLQATVANAAAMTGNLNAILADGRVNLTQALANFNDVSATLKSKTGQIDRIVDNVESFSDSLSRAQIPTLVADMSATLAALKGTIDRINEGEGSAGKLLHDEELYNALVESSHNLADLIEDVKARPGRYINISVFGRRNRE